MDLSELSNDALADGITLWAGRVAAGHAHLLTLVAEFDRREAWGGPGLLSCAHWLSWRVGLGGNAAREWVRVARALPAVPAVQAAFRAGSVSWSQVRAITRIATPTDRVDWVELARHSTAAQLERIVRGMRRSQVADRDRADPELASYRLRTRTRYAEDGSLTITVRASAQDGALILAALATTRTELDRRRTAQVQEPVTTAGRVPAQTRPAGEVPASATVPAVPRRQAHRPRRGPRTARRCGSWPGRPWSRSRPTTRPSAAGAARVCSSRSTRCPAGPGSGTASSCLRRRWSPRGSPSTRRGCNL